MCVCLWCGHTSLLGVLLLFVLSACSSWPLDGRVLPRRGSTDWGNPAMESSVEKWEQERKAYLFPQELLFPRTNCNNAKISRQPQCTMWNRANSLKNRRKQPLGHAINSNHTVFNTLWGQTAGNWGRQWVWSNTWRWDISTALLNDVSNGRKKKSSN